MPVQDATHSVWCISFLWPIKYGCTAYLSFIVLCCVMHTNCSCFPFAVLVVYRNMSITIIQFY